jgi:hypothetical protein
VKVKLFFRKINFLVSRANNNPIGLNMRNEIFRILFAWGAHLYELNLASFAVNRHNIVIQERVYVFNHNYNIAKLAITVKLFLMLLLSIQNTLLNFVRSRLSEDKWLSYLDFHNTLSYTMASPLSSLFIVSQVSAHQQVMLAAPASASP